MKAGCTYPLLDAQRYDDEHGEGYAFAQVADGFEGDMRIADCWVVDDLGNVHPGYDACPVPILSEDLDIDRGTMTTATRRERTPLMGWR